MGSGAAGSGFGGGGVFVGGLGGNSPQRGPGPEKFSKRGVFIFYFFNSSHFFTVKSLYFALDAIAETGLMFQHFFSFSVQKVPKNVLVWLKET